MKVTWTEQAWERLLEIERFVARDDPRAAAPLGPCGQIGSSSYEGRIDFVALDRRSTIQSAV